MLLGLINSMLSIVHNSLRPIPSCSGFIKKEIRDAIYLAKSNCNRSSTERNLGEMRAHSKCRSGECWRVLRIGKALCTLQWHHRTSNLHFQVWILWIEMGVLLAPLLMPLSTILLFTPAQWPCGRVSALSTGGSGFKPRPSHTKDFKNGTQYLPRLALSEEGWFGGCKLSPS